MTEMNYYQRQHWTPDYHCDECGYSARSVNCLKEHMEAKLFMKMDDSHVCPPFLVVSSAVVSGLRKYPRNKEKSKAFSSEKKISLLMVMSLNLETSTSFAVWDSGGRGGFLLMQR